MITGLMTVGVGNSVFATVRGIGGEPTLVGNRHWLVTNRKCLVRMEHVRVKLLHSAAS
jgi:hypothetical protein